MVDVLKNSSVSNVLGEFRRFADRVNLIVAVDHSGRAGNGFFQAIFDQHPEVLTCPWMHYIYSYIITNLSEDSILESSAVHAFLSEQSYFRYLYQEPDRVRTAQIRKFGGDPAAEVDRAQVRAIFDEIVKHENRISRRDAVAAMYFAYAVGTKRATTSVKYILVTDAISLRAESPYTGFSGRALDCARADFPNVRFAQLIRDPRASFASTNHQFINSLGNMYGVHWGSYLHQMRNLLRCRFGWDGVFVFGFLLLYFNQAYRAVERKKHEYRDHVVVVKNEDLNLAFDDAVGKLCERLGIARSSQWDTENYVPTMVGKPWTGTGGYNSAYQTRTDGPLANDPDTVARNVTGPNEYVTRRWRTRLSRREIYLIEWVLHDELVTYGYEFLELRPDNRRVMHLLGRLALPLRGELPTLAWIVRGRSCGWREVGDRVFFTLTFLPFYVGARAALLALILQGRVLARST